VTHDAPDWERRAGLIATQVLGVALCRYVLRLPPVISMPAAELTAAIGATLQHYLFGDLDGA
jgi:tetracycline repressor-like protein